MSNLIKDVKVRKAVRAWAGAIGGDKLCIVSNYALVDIIGYRIEFCNNPFKDIKNGVYPLDELCGEIACEPIKEMEGWRKNELKI